MSQSDDNITAEELEFEIQEAKKQYDKFPYYKKKQFESIRKAVFG